MISGAMDYTPCLGIAGEAAVKVVRFFFVLIQDLTLHPMFSKHIGPLVLFSKFSSAGLSAGLLTSQTSPTTHSLKKKKFLYFFWPHSM